MKNEMKTKEYKENKSKQDLRYESSLCKESRFKPFCG